jgi:hypothetical protein
MSVAVRVATVLLVAFGYACAAGSLGLVVLASGVGLLGGLAVGGTVFASLLAAGIVLRGRGFRVALDVLVLGVMIVWGLLLDTSFNARCVADPCGDTGFFRFLAQPDVYGLVVLHALTVVAYAVSRRRPEALRAPVEALVASLLVVGIIVHALVAAQFGSALLLGVVIPFGFAAVAPALVIVLYTAELVRRLRRRGEELGAPPSLRSPDRATQYRGPSAEIPEEDRARRIADWGLLGRAIAGSPLVLGVYALAMALVERRWTAAARVFTQTCDHTFSQLPILHPPPVSDCHYLCTVAAQGHARLVRPERFGRRGGGVIVVNRQLAVANAFEDLLHTRWPRFGALARRVYDRLGWPVSRWIRSPWAADAVYLAMKPAEWSFYLVLLLLDRGPPEARIDRMYR